MTDVLFFDYWLRGTRHFKFIQNKLNETNISGLLLHTSSWRFGEYKQKEEIFEGIHCRDISYYNYSLIRALQVEKPKVVILLNQQTEDRIITRYCRLKKIMTIYLMHGVIASDLLVNSKLIDNAFGLKARLNRFGKYRILFKEYIKAYTQNSYLRIFNLELYEYFFKLFISPGKITCNVWQFKDAYADITLVYSQYDFQLFTEKMGFDRGKVKIVGNYNMDSLFKMRELAKKEVSLTNSIYVDFDLPHHSKYVLYIESGFCNPGYVVEGWSMDLIALQIRNISILLKHLELFLVVKLHPSSDYTELFNKLNDIDNLKLTIDYDLASLTLNALAVLGQSSSALRLPVILQIPLLILSLDHLNLLIKDYVENEFGILINSYEELEEQLKIILNGKFKVSANYLKNVNHFIGPFDGKSEERINNIILSSINA